MAADSLIPKKMYALLPIDYLLGGASYYLAYYWRFDGVIPASYWTAFSMLWFMYGIAKVLSFTLFRIYKRVWKYAGTQDLMMLANSLILANLGLIAAGYFMHILVPRSVFLFTFMFDLIISGAMRVIPKVIKEKGQLSFQHKNIKRLLVIGAGDAGVLVVKELFRQPSPMMLPVGFVDDDVEKQNARILGLPVFGSRDKIRSIIGDNAIHEVLIAIPSAPGQIIKEIYEACRELQVPVRTLPRMYDIINGQITVDQIREVKLEDLLGREPVKLDMDLLLGTFSLKRILVTGAGGSIGSELCRQLCRCNPAELILVGHDENPVFEIELELKTKYPDLKISPVIADIKDYDRVNRVFSQYHPQAVFHAAAHKHVPLMEANPGEAIKNNVLGTRNVALASDKYNTEIFVLISTDKAVNPTSVMGATKRIAEIIIQELNEVSKTRFTAVRFGNVLGSRGSVIPIFQEQIRQGGPVTVTHPEMRRYFMTIPEAVQLVLQAAGMSKGGEIFVLDMGKPVKIVDMARELIKLSGFEPDKEIVIQFTGIRPGEKMYEELLTDAEGTSATKHRRIFIAKKQEYSKQEVKSLFGILPEEVQYMDKDKAFELLGRLEGKSGKYNIS